VAAPADTGTGGEEAVELGACAADGNGVVTAGAPESFTSRAAAGWLSTGAGPLSSNAEVTFHLLALPGTFGSAPPGRAGVVVRVGMRLVCGGVAVTAAVDCGVNVRASLE
jgi:hypothetical protein